ncbi:hypothetical protein HPP92_021606, partial [Vanilla planifolia]
MEQLLLPMRSRNATKMLASDLMLGVCNLLSGLLSVSKVLSFLFFVSCWLYGSIKLHAKCS